MKLVVTLAPDVISTNLKYENIKSRENVIASEVLQIGIPSVPVRRKLRAFPRAYKGEHVLGEGASEKQMVGGFSPIDAEVTLIRVYRSKFLQQRECIDTVMHYKPVVTGESGNMDAMPYTRSPRSR